LTSGALLSALICTIIVLSVNLTGYDALSLKNPSLTALPQPVP